MSVSQVILFYSKHNKHSFKVKNVLEEYVDDIKMLSVDNPTTKELLLEDDQYSIREVPALLVRYTNGDHEVFVGTSLNNWVARLIENVNNYNHPTSTPLGQPDATQLPPPPPLLSPPPLPPPPQMNPHLRPSATPSQSGLGSISPVHAAMISEHIKDAPPAMPIAEAPPAQAPSAVKNEGESAVDLAARMRDEREQYDEQIDNNKPFL
jgi:hypothetical protein